MRRRADRASVLPVRALYGVPELAEAAGISRFVLYRMLKNKGCVLERSGRAVSVTLDEIEKKWPALWESVKHACALRRAVSP